MHPHGTGARTSGALEAAVRAYVKRSLVMQRAMSVVRAGSVRSLSCMLTCLPVELPSRHVPTRRRLPAVFALCILPRKESLQQALWITIMRLEANHCVNRGSAVLLSSAALAHKNSAKSCSFLPTRGGGGGGGCVYTKSPILLL